MKPKTVRAVYPGTFDPMTLGHYEVVRRAAGLFSEVIVAVAANEKKRPLLPLEERVRLAQEVCASLDNVRVVGFTGLLKNVVEKENVQAIVRGARAVSDFDFEFQLAGMNRRLMPNVETIFLTPGEHYQFVSGTFIREIAAMNLEDVRPFVPEPVYESLKLTFKSKEM